MRATTLSSGLLAIAALLSGCSQMQGYRAQGPANVRTDVSVGDRPISVAAGESGASTRQMIEPPETPSRSGARISGRVYDDRGQPAAGAKVRLAVNGAPGGRIRATTTDESGGFTIRDLHPGSSYTLIAEFEDQDVLLSGRIRTEAPRTGARIDLAPESEESGKAAIKPARTKVDPISRIEDESGDEVPAARRGSVVNEEDVAPEADEEPRVSRVQRSESARHASWSRHEEATNTRRTARAGAEEPVSTAPSQRPVSGDALDDEGPNPLPPALEVEPQALAPAVIPAEERVAARRGVVDGNVKQARADDSWQEPSRLIPEDLVPRTDDAAAPRKSPKRDDAIIIGDEPAPARVAARRKPGALARAGDRGNTADAPQDDPIARKPVARQNAPRTLDRPTWGEVALQSREVPLDEGVRKAALATRAADPSLATRSAERLAPASTAAIATPTRPTSPGLLGSLFARPRPAQPSDSPTPGICRYDPAERKLIELELPGIDGKNVALKSIDADLILLDFWGSWCQPCKVSIPHLIEIQTKLGPKYVQVVGIACERSSNPAERAAAAARAVKQFGINYPVLLSSMDGKCPVQNVLQVHFYPTMILLDREGHILAREHGATETTLGRIDRAIADHLRSNARTSAAR